MGAVRSSQINAAQAAIVRAARQLDAEGVIVIAAERRRRPMSEPALTGRPDGSPRASCDGWPSSRRCRPPTPTGTGARTRPTPRRATAAREGYEAGYADGLARATEDANLVQRRGVAPGRRGHGCPDARRAHRPRGRAATARRSAGRGAPARLRSARRALGPRAGAGCQSRARCHRPGSRARRGDVAGSGPDEPGGRRDPR